MLIHGHKRFRTEAFGGVQELRDFVSDHRDVILGKPTILLDPGDLEKLGCFERTPDFVTVDVVARHWTVVVIEPRGLTAESQAFQSLVKQEQITRRPGTRKSISDMIINQVKTRASVLKSFESAGVHAIDVRDVLGEVFSKDPFFDLVVEQPSEPALQALTAAAPSFRVWPVRKLVQEDAREDVIYEVPESPRVRAIAPPVQPRPIESPRPQEGARPEPVAQGTPRPAQESPAATINAPSADAKAAETEAVTESPKSQAEKASNQEPATTATGGERDEPQNAQDAEPSRKIGFTGRDVEPAFLRVPEDEIDISLDELVTRGYLKVGERLVKRYRWATGEVSQFEGTVTPDGGFQVQEIKDAPPGPQGTPEDGMWRNGAGVTLADLKLRYRRQTPAGQRR